MAKRGIGSPIGARKRTLDDREKFKKSKGEFAAEMAADEGLRTQALDVVTRSDQHNWSYQWNWLGVPMIQMPPDVIVALNANCWL